MLKSYRIVAAAALISFSFTTPSQAESEILPPFLANGLLKGYLKIVNSFDAASGMRGYVVVLTGDSDDVISEDPHLFYVTPDGKTIIAGDAAIIDAQGNDLSEKYAEDYFPKPDFSAAYEELANTSFVQTGNPEGPAAYVFFEPNCGYCDYLYRAAKPYIAVGANIRWVPVAFLSDDSAGKLASIMNAKDPTSALESHHAKFRSGGISVTEVDTELQESLDHNKEIMESVGISGTPAILYQGTGGKPLLTEGMPDLDKLGDIFGKPEQPQTDPFLARFR